MKPSMTKSFSSVSNALSNIDALSANERNLPRHNQSPHAQSGHLNNEITYLFVNWLHSSTSSLQTT